MFSNDSNNNGLFNIASRNINVSSSSIERDLSSLVSSLNIIDPKELSQEQLSIILKRVDDYEGLFTTQQLENIDYNKFKNHVIFDSAVAKTVYSFDQIQNIPYDKDEFENIKFFNKMDGYTNFLIKNKYPTFTGYAEFDQEQMIVVYDEQGRILKDSKTRNKNILNSKNKNFSLDFWLKPKLKNGAFINNQVVFSKIDTFEENGEEKIKNGILCFLTSYTNSVTKCYLNFSIYIDGFHINTKTLIDIGSFQNICISVDQNKKTSFLINGNIVLDSNTIKDPADVNLQNKAFGGTYNNNHPFVIGNIFIQKSDSISNSLEINNTASVGLIGCIDEFRFFHKIRSHKTVKKEMNKNIYAQRSLKLYLRLNEPSGNYTNSCLCIDYSGNKIHGIFYEINNNALELINDTSNFKINNDTPLSLEEKNFSPVLNSGFNKVTELRESLIQEAKEYDSNNPNLIFNLMPKHYFLNTSDFQDLPVYSNEDAYQNPSEITFNSTTNSITNRSSLTTSIPANNDLSNIVLIWARFFDKLKLYISSITNLLNVDYDSINNQHVIGMQIPILCKMYGVKFKEILPNATKNKLNNENLVYEDIISDISIRKIQNILWQRFLINTQDFLKSKGTLSSIESTFNAFGIESKKLINTREYSSENIIVSNKNFDYAKAKKNFINFGNNINLLLSTNPTFTETTPNEKLLLEIEKLYAKTSNNQNDDTITVNAPDIDNGLEDDWSIEMFFNFKDSVNKRKNLNKSKKNQSFLYNKNYKDKQTLLTCIQHSEANVTDGRENFIEVYYEDNWRNNDLGKITIEIYPFLNDESAALNKKTLVIENVNIYDTFKYFLISQKTVNNKIEYYASLRNIGVKSIFSSLHEASVQDITKTDTQHLSSSKAFNLKIGNIKISENVYADFEGELYKLRVWKKFLSEKERKSHAENIENIGTDDFKPLKYLVADFELKETNRVLSNSIYSWNLTDISRNVYYDTATKTYKPYNQCKIITMNSNQEESSVIGIDEIIKKQKNSKIDEFSATNKFNILSFEKEENKSLFENKENFPLHETPSDFIFTASNRVSIEMSISKVINDDIENIISDLNEFTLKLSNFQSRYSYQYKFLEEIRQNYFNKYKDNEKIKYASLINIFKYFDNIMSSILYDIVPSKVRFDGFNFVYESHLIERHKYEYKNKDSINTIIDGSDSAFTFSRKNLNSRRSNVYNSNRSI